LKYLPRVMKGRELKMLRFRSLSVIVGVCVVMSVAVWAEGEQTPRKLTHSPSAGKRPLAGYVGGPYKVIAADFTGDKIIDLAVSHYPIDAITVEQGDGKGRFSRLAIFTIPADNRPDIEPIFNIAEGDIDGDGLLDLAIGVGGTAESPAGRAVVARNIGQGRFEKMAEYPVQSMAKGVALADLDNDGRLDLMYTARGAGYPTGMIIGKLLIRQGLGDWKFGPVLEFDAGHSAYYVETADLNNDGFLDILVPNEHAPTVQYYMNPGKQIFKHPEAIVHRVVEASKIPGRRSHAINDVRAADFNGDGKLDLVTANLGTNTMSVFLGNGDGTFQRDTLYGGGGGYCAFLAVGDLDEDGHLDFVVTHWAQDTMAVFLNRGDGTFFPGTAYKTAMRNYGVAVLDADGDGKLDVVTANYIDRSISLLKGKGDGSFEPAVTTPKGLRLREGKWTPD